MNLFDNVPIGHRPGYSKFPSIWKTLLIFFTLPYLKGRRIEGLNESRIACDTHHSPPHSFIQSLNPSIIHSPLIHSILLYMRNDLLLTLLLVSWISGATYYYVCHIRQHCCGTCSPLSNMTAFELTAPPADQLRIAGEGLLLESDKGIVFGRDESLPVVAPATDTALQQVKQYLDDHADKALYITGWYDDSEKNTTLMENLGLARAEAVRRRLVAAGVSDKQIGTAGRSSIELTFLGDSLFSGLTFTVTDELPDTSGAINPDTLAALQNRLQASSPVLYFEMGATSLQVSDTLQRYLQDAQNYLLAYPDRSIVLTGHTDNVGSAEKNVTYGQERADFTKDILSELGINPQQIKTRSEGESQPIASNDTQTGRSKNRRVEITIEGLKD